MSDNQFGPPQPGFGPPQPQAPAGVPPQAGYGYPQQAPAQPQQPWGGGQVPPQAFPAGAPGGFPPGYPAPPKKSRKALWIVLGCVAGVILLGGGLLGYFIYDTASKTGKNKVVLPETFHSMTRDPNEDSAKELANELQSDFSKGDSAWTPTEVVSSIYHSADNEKAAIVAGAYGNVLLPSKQVDAVFTGATSGGAAITDRKDVDPGPLGGRMSCGTTETGGEKVGFCAWADGSSVMMLMEFDASTAVSLDQIAADARELRGISEIPK
ncbi:hypothetical protein AB0K51_10100 [Kitasatospora sp. NPDC049285]|uniref:hypothetical protein n=1 Tax=Kitasatospora sp. NPDC049285 TaxID=3157096 RepID=UPI0034195812